MEVYTAIVGFFQTGGVFMYPIVLILAAGSAIAVERYVFLSRTKASNQQLWQKLVPLIRTGDYQEAVAIALKSKAAVSRILTGGLERVRSARNPADIETALEEGFMEIVPRLEKRTHYLATFANVATLLGLLGTIIGLIQAFTAVSNADPAQKADLLSSSISVAMNTTAFGLMVAIPLLLVHAVLQTKTNEIVDGLEAVAVKFINTVTQGDADPAKPV